MLYKTPRLSDADLLVLTELDGLSAQLRGYLYEPRRWYGTLRRATFARAVQGSNSIEGYHASVEDVAAVIAGDDPPDLASETQHAIAGYQDAMTFVLQTARAGQAVDASLLRSLHFMMMKHELRKNPGQWRPEAVWVHNSAGDTVYTAPDRAILDELIDAFVTELNADDGPLVVRAAMAHLNLALIHPFSDGNGRMARCVQSFVLAAGGVMSPEFSSIEEYLGRNTQAYYDVLAEVGGSEWLPDRDTSPWIRFCLTAHVRQARTLLRRVAETEELWDRCDQLADRFKVPRRSIGALCDAARGWSLRRSLYMSTVMDSVGEEITEATATRDLSALVSAGLLEPVGEKRARRYRPMPVLRAEWAGIQNRRGAADTYDPYEHLQPTLPGLDVRPD